MRNTGLTYRERANLASLRIKKAQIKNQYGGAIQVVSTPEEILGSRGILALPLRALPEKVYAFILKNVKQDANGKYIDPAAWEKVDDKLIDVVTALEDMADRLEGKQPEKREEEVISLNEESAPEWHPMPVPEEPELEMGKIQAKPKPVYQMTDEEFLSSL